MNPASVVGERSVPQTSISRGGEKKKDLRTFSKPLQADLIIGCFSCVFFHVSRHRDENHSPLEGGGRRDAESGLSHFLRPVFISLSMHDWVVLMASEGNMLAAAPFSQNDVFPWAVHKK